MKKILAGLRPVPPQRDPQNLCSQGKLMALTPHLARRCSPAGAPRVRLRCARTMFHACTCLRSACPRARAVCWVCSCSFFGRLARRPGIGSIASRLSHRALPIAFSQALRDRRRSRKRVNVILRRPWSRCVHPICMCLLCMPSFLRACIFHARVVCSCCGCHCYVALALCCAVCARAVRAGAVRAVCLGSLLRWRRRAVSRSFPVIAHRRCQHRLARRFLSASCCAR